MTADLGPDRVETPPGASTLDVWSAALDPIVPALTELAADLSADEHARAARFASPRDRDRFIVGRAFMRRLLARYVGGTAQGVRLRQGTHGKPAVESDVVSFNLAHSGDLAVCAIGPGRHALGVDVERIKPMTDEAGVAKMILSPRERQDLESLSGPRRLRRLLEIWTCKEAILKGVGTGLDRPLAGLEITFAEGDEPHVRELDMDDAGGMPFRLRLFEPADGYVGAVATTIPGAGVRFVQWRWQ